MEYVRRRSSLTSKLFKLAMLCALASIGVAGLLFYHQATKHDREIADRDAIIAAQKVTLSRLTADRRVADLIVLDQHPTAEGHLQTTVLFQEYDGEDRPINQQRFVLNDNRVYVSALVIRFDQKYVEEADDLRGRSICLFENIYALEFDPTTHQIKGHYETLDRPGRAPTVYQSKNPLAADFEQKLWTKFWALATDPKLRDELQVKNASGQVPNTLFLPGFRYTLRLQNNGSLDFEQSELPADFKAVLLHTSEASAAAPG